MLARSDVGRHLRLKPRTAPVSLPRGFRSSLLRFHSTTSTLTETERRVAELVGSGRPNQETAAELLMSVKTVEANLTRIYRKLPVRSGTELANRMNNLHLAPHRD